MAKNIKIGLRAKLRMPVSQWKELVKGDDVNIHTGTMSEVEIVPDEHYGNNQRKGDTDGE